MGEGELSEAVMNLALGLHSKFDVKGDELGKARERDIITSDSLIQIGREIRQMVISSFA
jgi:hypothetical protein